MNATSVGQISLDLTVNKQNFQKQMTGIQNLAKKTAGLLAGAFAIGKIVNFGKACIQLGSDLSEVQNVVDSVFPHMSKQVNAFARDAMGTYGLSETMAKQFTGNFGAMAKSFGITESAAYDMSTSLTGLAGDIASFYNMSQDEAFVKLKSVFTGETEALKSLGVVMTKTALDEYALAQGIDKTTSEMTEAEKVMLRYRFVMDNLSTASGDFARTSDGWANQMRVLKLQIESIKASIGQGLVVLFTPIIKAVNMLLGRLVTLANAFKSFVGMITGKDTSSNMTALGASGEMASEGLGAAADAADDSAESSTKAGKAAKKAAKEIEKSLMGFDKINKIQAPASSDDTSDAAGDSGAAGAGGALGSAVDFGQMAQGETVMDGMSKKLDGLIKRAKELAGLFGQGFKIGFGDAEKNIPRIQEGIERIRKALREIFTDPDVVNAANEWANSCATTMGIVAGSAASIGVSVATNLVLGAAGYLEQSGSYISERISGLFKIGVEHNQIVADVSTFLADIAGVLTGDNAVACTTAIIGIFSDGFLGATQLAAQFAVDMEGLITKPFTENSEEIATVIDNILGPASEVLNTIWNSVKTTMEKAITVYDDSVSPMLKTFTETFSKLVKTFTDGFNTYMAPVLDRLAEKFSEVWEGHVQPTIDKFIELIGAICKLITKVWKMFIEPLLVWLVAHIWPVLAPIFERIGKGMLDMLSMFSDVVGGIIKFVTNMVNGISDALDGIPDAFSAMWDFVRGVINDLLGGVEGMANGVISAVNAIAGSINGMSFDVPDWVPYYGGSSLGFNLPTLSEISLPRLANGGYVPRNSPHLAMIGDNRTQGEIVAPEGKMLELLKAANPITREDLESILNLNTMRILAAMAEVGFFVDGKELARAVQAGQNELKVQYNSR